MSSVLMSKKVQERVDAMALAYYERLDIMDAYDQAGPFRRLFMKNYKDSARQFMKDVNDSIDQSVNRRRAYLTSTDFLTKTTTFAYAEEGVAGGSIFVLYNDDYIALSSPFQLIRTDSAEGYAEAVIEVALRIEHRSSR